MVGPPQRICLTRRQEVEVTGVDRRVNPAWSAG
jgi:hypothetical protein